MDESTVTTAPDFAHLVVYRHPCDCATASRPLAAGENPEHRFDVDGEPFPWYISEDGPTFTRLAVDLYAINVTIITLHSGREWAAFEVRSDPFQLLIAGRVFPWHIRDTGFTYRQSNATWGSVELSFLALDVDTDSEISDETFGWIS